MKNLVLIIALSVGGVTTLCAQDTIVFKNSDHKVVKISQIKSNELVCKDYLNLDGPDYIYELSHIREIHFQNGLVQTYEIKDTDSDEIEYINDIAVKKQRGSQGEYQNKLSETLPLFQNYSEKRDYYKNTPYISQYSDPYSPWVAGIASYFLPGLGQMVSGETGRGFAFMGGVATSYLVMFVGVASIGDDYYYDGYYHNGSSNSTLAPVLILAGLFSAAGISIWSIFDAVKVAKVNNLYARDLRRQNDVSVKVSPYINAGKQTLSLSNTFSAGLSLQVNF